MIARPFIEWYMVTASIDNVSTTIGSVVGANYVALGLLKDKIFLLAGDKNGDIAVVGTIKWSIAAVAHYHSSDMIWGETLMKSFAGFRQLVVVWWRPEFLWRSPRHFLRGARPPNGTMVNNKTRQRRMYRKNINARPVVSLMIWYASEMSIVATWRVRKTNRHENGSIFWCFGGQNWQMRLDGDHSHLITAVSYHHLSDIISGSSWLKSFVGFLQMVVLL